MAGFKFVSARCRFPSSLTIWIFNAEGIESISSFCDEKFCLQQIFTIVLEVNENVAVSPSTRSS